MSFDCRPDSTMNKGGILVIILFRQLDLRVSWILTPPLSLQFRDFGIMADSDSRPSKTLRKIISDGQNVSSFLFIRV